MKFSNLKEVNKAYTAAKLASGTARVTNTPMFKKALMEFMEQENISIPQMTDATGINATTMYAWSKQYEQGLFSLEGAYAVSQKSLDVNESILKKLKQKRTELDKQIEMIETLEAAGFQINEKVTKKRKLKAVG